MNGRAMLCKVCLLLAIVCVKAITLDLDMINDYQTMLDVSKSVNQFGGEFYETISESEPENFVVSPLSAAMVLRMAAYGARQKTVNEMHKALHFNTDNPRQERGTKNLISSINRPRKAELSIANRIFLAKGIKIKEEFSNITEQIFHSTTENVNFEDSLAASNVINNWCENQTHSRIKDIVQPRDFNADTALVLINAVYFKGSWLSKFNDNETELRDFHVNSETVKKIPMMHRLGSYRYGVIPELDARYIELPYEYDPQDIDFLSMIIVLPNRINGLPAVEAGLKNMKLFRFLSGDMHEVNLYLPKFKIETSIDLKASLEKLGMKEMFKESANFTGIVDSPSLKVSKVIQKAFVEVNEEGSEAAASTVFDLENRVSISDEYRKSVELIIDRPFIMIITNRDTIIFNGRYKG